MGDRVTRQFVDEVTGDPITGAQFRLVSKTDPLYAPVDLVEIPDQIPGTPDGKYASPSTVQTGVYAIERFQGGAWNETGDELTVQPGRWRAPWESENIVADHLGAVLRVSGYMFAEDPATIGNLNIVLSYAAANGYDVVEVGGLRGVFAWTGDSALVIPDGLTVDLLGATIQCTTEDIAPVECAGAATILNGTIAGSGTGASQHITSTDPAKEISCINVAFTGLGSNHLTVSTSAAAVARATFISCSNVVVPDLGTGSVATQVVIGGRQNASQLGGDPFIPPAHASATATELGDFFRFVQSSVVPAGSEIPPTSAPFTNMRQVAAALRELWFTYKPLIASAADSTNLVYAKKDGDSGIDAQSNAKISAISVYNGLASASVTVQSVQRKAMVIEKGKFREAKIYVAFYALCQWNFSIGTADYVDSAVQGGFTLEMADFKNDLIAAFPGCNIEAVAAKAAANMTPGANVSGLQGAKYAGIEGVIKIQNPTSIQFILPTEAFRWFPANVKVVTLLVEAEARLVLADNSANGQFQKYATLANQ